MADYKLRVFPKETLDDIAREFYAYFKRKQKSKLKPHEAVTLINYASGPVPRGGGFGAVDYARPHVTGGGLSRRPSESEVEDIVRRHSPDEPHEWDAVFDELMRQAERSRDDERVIFMTFRDGYSWYVICDELYIKKDKYFDQRRAILERAGVIALKTGVLKPWKC